MAAAVTMLSTGCYEDSMHVDGEVVGRRNFRFLEEAILELASEWVGGMGSGQSRCKSTNTPPRVPVGERNWWRP